MVDSLLHRRYRTAYSRLLRLYPRPFRDRFEEGMAQTFHDMCREKNAAGPKLFGLALGVFLETSLQIGRENLRYMPELAKTALRVALGALAALMVPLVASQIVDGWNWNPGAFVFLYTLFFALGMVFTFVAKRMAAWSYKVGVGVSLLTAFVLGWSNMVHVTGTENPANFIYYTVLAVGVVGAAWARLRARGLALTLFLMASTLAVISLLLPSGAPPDLARNMAIGHIIQVVLFAASGLLFRHASLSAAR